MKMKWWKSRSFLSIIGYAVIAIGVTFSNKVISWAMIIPVATILLISAFWNNPKEYWVTIVLRLIPFFGVIFVINWLLLGGAFWDNVLAVVFAAILVREATPFLRSWWEGRKR